MAKEKLQWHTEKRRVDSLKFYGKNPRIMPDKNMHDLMNSVKKVGLAEIPAIDIDGTLVAGNQRVRALLFLDRGKEEIDVRVPNR